MNSWEYDHVSKIATPSSLIQEIGNLRDEELGRTVHRQEPKQRRNIFEEIQHALHEERLRQARGSLCMEWI
jgi:E1A-binding protein p400